MQVGAPEDLVLSGAFDAAFRAEGVTFDAQTGAFRVNSETQGRISVIGDGLPALWTRRALERAGFTVANSDGSALVRIEVETGCWRLLRGDSLDGDSLHEYSSLYDLVQAVRSA